ncbi:hypothetical protein WN943_018105 [Citrus x changshan-huyou]
MSRCSNIILMDLSVNQLLGNIPPEFGSLSKIKDLRLFMNNLTGSIPSSLGNLSSIIRLSLTYNNIAGSIPDTLGYLENLSFLALGGNMLSATIPSSIFNRSSITSFSVLSLNHTSFSLNNQFYTPDAETQIAQNLDTCVTPFWGFEFSIHCTQAHTPSINNASKLEEFLAAENKLTGEVPHLEKLQRFSQFVITTNHLGRGGRDDFNFLCSLTNATRLELLLLNDNNFGGLIRECISNFSTTLASLFLDNNKIFGSIPPGIGKLVNLRRLYVWNNKLSGTIPYAIGDLQNLRMLGMSGNRFSGNIPLSVGNLKMLIQLEVSENFLQGTIPSSLCQCKSLIGINFSKNNLSGTIPPQLFGLSSLSISLDLSRNHFTGSLPIEVGNLKNLGVLDISGNLLSGEIPISLGSCTSLEKLLMQGNKFYGPIPSSLRSLRGLSVLDFAQNNLSGEIPKFLAGFKLLENVNLSYNDLGGKVRTNRRSHQKFKCYVSYGKHLLKATDGFSSTHLIGVGSFGSVYKGLLDEDGTVVAIKVLNLQRPGASKSFMAECKALRNVRHRNLDRVITSCSSVASRQ